MCTVTRVPTQKVNLYKCLTLSVTKWTLTGLFGYIRTLGSVKLPIRQQAHAHSGQ